MTGFAMNSWLAFWLACCINFLLSVFAYQKPAFCDKKGDPFSFLWRVSNRDPPSYLFGTIHVPYTEVWPHVPQNAKAAFFASDRLLLELDLVDPSTTDLLSKCQMLPAGTSLSEVLPHDLYSRLERHLEHMKGKVAEWTSISHDSQRRKEEAGNGDALFHMMAGEWRRKRPVWVMLLLDSLTEAEVRGRGTPVLDLFLAQEAKREGKKETEAVEEVEEQCRPLNSLNYSQVLFVLNHTLTQHEQRENDPHSSSSYSTDDLVRHYKCGDLDSSVFGQDSSVEGHASLLTPTAPHRLLNASSSAFLTQKNDHEEDARSVDEYMRMELILNRNRRMGIRVVDLLRRNTGESLFFAFGAGHFLGNNSILDFIRQQGFEVENIPVNSKISKRKSKKSVQFDGLKLESKPELAKLRQNRRFSRHPIPGAAPSTGLRQEKFDTSTRATVTTHRRRRFNDLWVRMDTEKKSFYVRQNEIVPQKAFQKWHKKTHGQNFLTSAGTTLLNFNPLIVISSTLITLPKSLYTITLIGIT